MKISHSKILLTILLIVLFVVLSVVTLKNEKVQTFYQNEIIKREELTKSLLALNEADFTVGSENPKARLLVYGDTDCPFCKKFEPRFTRLLATYPKDVAITYRQYKLSIYPGSRFEHIALECVGILDGAEQYRAFQNDVLFNNLFSGEGDYFEAAYGLAAQFLPNEQVIGLRECMQDKKTIDRIQNKAGSGAVLGVRITPTYFIIDHMGNYKMHEGSAKYDTLLNNINNFLGEGNILLY